MNASPASASPATSTTAAPKGTSLGKWLLRIFLGSFLLAVAAPVAIALAVLHLSADTRALRNAALESSDARWEKKVEVNVGSVPFMVARMVLPFTKAPEEARMALDAMRSVEISVNELRSHEPDRARVLEEADRRMSKRGWDRLVCVLDRKTAVAVYVSPENAKSSDVRISVLVMDGKHMVAATGRGRLAPLYELAMQKSPMEFLARKGNMGPFMAEMHRK